MPRKKVTADVSAPENLTLTPTDNSAEVSEPTAVVEPAKKAKRAAKAPVAEEPVEKPKTARSKKQAAPAETEEKKPKPSRKVKAAAVVADIAEPEAVTPEATLPQSAAVEQADPEPEVAEVIAVESEPEPAVEATPVAAKPGRKERAGAPKAGTRSKRPAKKSVPEEAPEAGAVTAPADDTLVDQIPADDTPSDVVSSEAVSSEVVPGSGILSTWRSLPSKAAAPMTETLDEIPAPAPAVARVRTDLPEITDEQGGIEIVWRAHTSATRAAVPEPKAVAAEPASTETEATAPAEAGEDRNRRRRRRSKGGRPDRVSVREEESDAIDEDETEVEAIVEEAPVEVVAKPRTTLRPREVVVKPAVIIPADAPQVVLRNGTPTIVRNHRAYPPFFFFGSPDTERHAETTFDELRMAAESGVHLHSFLIDFEVDVAAVAESAALAAFLLAQTVAADPQAQVLFRVVFRAPRGWNDDYAAARYRTLDGSTAEPSVCDDGFWKVAENCLDAFVRALRLIDLRDHILGVHLERGEWFLPQSNGYDNSRAAEQKFREWARTRYNYDEVALRAAWFDGGVRFDTIEIPDFHAEGAEGEKFVRSSRKQRRYVDYHLFLSDETVRRIGELAYVAKAASDGYFIVGVSYGYTFEWSHPASGHLALGKLLRTEEVDIIAGPPSYRNREPGGTGSFPGPIDSFALNGKLFISEEDFRTSLGTGQDFDEDFNPVMKTPQALESVHWRGVGAALAHGSGMAWMDLWGNGWLRSQVIWDRAAKVREVLTQRLEATSPDPDVAVFIDERSLAYLVDPNAFAMLVQNVRESVLRAGVSAGFYLISDLAHREKFPESKLYIFVNAWDIRPELRAAVKSRLQRDGKVLFWLYSAGLFDSGREALERAREVTGIALKPQPFYSKAGTSLINRRHPLAEAFPEKSIMGSSQLEPSYFAIPEGAAILGEYSQTGLPSFVVKEFNESAEQHWTSVFLGEPVVNPALIRTLAQMAGAHVWSFNGDVVHVRSPFVSVHCSGSGPRTIPLPDKQVAYDVLLGEWARADASHLRFNGIDGVTHTFLVGARTEIEHLLQTDPAKTLYVESIPPRDANVRTDASQFDVPIMRLGEWVGSSESDDVADEWLLRPLPEVEELSQATESAEDVGRRRRRRGNDRNDRQRDNRPAKPDARVTSTSTDGDLSLSFSFRKRD